MIVVKLNQKPSRISLVMCLDGGDMGLGCSTGRFGGEHNCCAVRVVGTDVTTVMASGLLKAHPDIGLGLFKHMPKVQGGIGIG